MIPLTLRPTGLRNSAAFGRLADWCVIEDGEPIGRIYEVPAAPPDRRGSGRSTWMGKRAIMCRQAGMRPRSKRPRRSFGPAWRDSRLGRSGDTPYPVPAC
jgi:hypothetical protein